MTWQPSKIYNGMNSIILPNPSAILTNQFNCVVDTSPFHSLQLSCQVPSNALKVKKKKTHTPHRRNFKTASDDAVLQRRLHRHKSFPSIHFKGPTMLLNKTPPQTLPGRRRGEASIRPYIKKHPGECKFNISVPLPPCAAPDDPFSQDWRHRRRHKTMKEYANDAKGWPSCTPHTCTGFRWVPVVLNLSLSFWLDPLYKFTIDNHWIQLEVPPQTRKGWFTSLHRTHPSHQDRPTNLRIRARIPFSHRATPVELFITYGRGPTYKHTHTFTFTYRTDHQVEMLSSFAWVSGSGPGFWWAVRASSHHQPSASHQKVLQVQCIFPPPLRTWVVGVGKLWDECLSFNLCACPFPTNTPQRKLPFPHRPPTISTPLRLKIKSTHHHPTCAGWTWLRRLFFFLPPHMK